MRNARLANFLVITTCVYRSCFQGAEVILDEPFVGIDMSSEKVIMDILKSLKIKVK